MPEAPTTTPNKPTSTLEENRPVHEYDLIAIGGGSGGLGAAGIARTFGLKTLLIEAKAHDIGGDCLNYGCVPSKALIHVSRLAHNARQASDYGLSVSGKADFAAALRHVHAAQKRIREHENAEWLRQQEHQEVVIGWARFVDEQTLEVNGELYRAQRIVMATGSRPRKLEVPGVDTVKGLQTNRTFFEKERKLPEHLLIVGGGAIGCELGQAMRRLGSEVTIVDLGERLLEREIELYSERLGERFEREGIEVYHRSEVTAFEGTSTAVVATTTGSGDKEKTREHRIEFDEVLIAIGRDASPKDMNLEAAGIEVDEHGVMKVDDRYRTTNSHVYAVGDAMGREKLSHGAEMHNRDLIVNMLSPIDKRHNLKTFSWVTFTHPEIATFGLTAKQLDERSIDYETIDQPFTDDDRAIVSGYADEAHLTLYVEPQLVGGAKILGGSMIAPGAGEMIQEWVLALETGATLNDIFNKIYAYPVASRINQKAAFQYRQGGLGEELKGLIRWWWRV